MAEQRLNQSFYAMVFYATEDTIRTERQLSRIFETAIMPTPREISESCGFAIRFSHAEEEELMAQLSEIEADCALYYFGPRDENKKRAVKLVAEINRNRQY